MLSRVLPHLKRHGVMAWQVEGYDGSTQIFRAAVSMSEKQVICLLQRLAARDLTHEEIVAASLPKKRIGYSPLLEAHSRDTCVMVGSNPHYVARLLNTKRRATNAP